MNDTLRVRDFSEIPGPRLRSQGKYSGEEFYEEILLPAFQKVLNVGSSLMVDLDGVDGYATVFLDETFGKLARYYGSQVVREHLILHCEEDDTLLEDIEEYYQDADKIRKQVA
jgi:hypothetical protein